MSAFPDIKNIPYEGPLYIQPKPKRRETSPPRQDPQ